MHPEPNDGSDPYAGGSEHLALATLLSEAPACWLANCALPQGTRDQSDLNPTNVNFWLTAGSDRYKPSDEAQTSTPKSAAR